VLINLQHLDVVNGKPEADGSQDEQSADPRLSRHCPAKSFASDHDRPDIGNQRQ
jgi:hypothetical protein